MTHHATVRADLLFWSIVDAPGVRAGPIPAGLWPMVEDEIPIEADQLWAIGTPIGAGSTVVCAIRRVDLIDLAPGAVTLRPESVPAFIPAPAASFNFLVDEYEPRQLRRARLHRHLASAACTLLAAFLVAIGLSRRAGAWNAEALAASTATSDVIASVAPSPGWMRDDLTLELMYRRQSIPAELSPPGDAAEALAAVIAGWPTQSRSNPQSIAATGNNASISVTIRGDAEAFLSNLKPPEGWTLDEPRLASIDKGTRLNLELRREVTR